MFHHLILIAALAAPTTETPKRIGIIAFDGALTADITAPAEVLGMALSLGKRSWVVEIIGAHDKDWIRTAEGLRTGVDHRISNAPKMDVLIVPGSNDPTESLRLPGLQAYLTRAALKADRVASHCAGAFLLASTGVLDGRRVTTYPTGAATLKTQHPKILALEGPTVVVDGRVITSNGGVVSYEGTVVLVAQLFGEPLAKKVFDGVLLNRVIEWSRIKAHL